MQQKQILKMQQVWMYQKFSKKVDTANLKPNMGKLDFGKLKYVPTNLRNLKH